MLLNSITELSSASTAELTSSGSTSFIEVSLKKSGETAFKSYKYDFSLLTTWISSAIYSQIEALSGKVESYYTELSHVISDEISIRRDQVRTLLLSVENISGAYDKVKEWEKNLSNDYLRLKTSDPLIVTGPVTFDKVLNACATSAYWN